MSKFSALTRVALQPEKESYFVKVLTGVWTVSFRLRKNTYIHQKKTQDESRRRALGRGLRCESLKDFLFSFVLSQVFQILCCFVISRSGRSGGRTAGGQRSKRGGPGAPPGRALLARPARRESRRIKARGAGAGLSARARPGRSAPGQDARLPVSQGVGSRPPRGGGRAPARRPTPALARLGPRSGIAEPPFCRL